MKKYSLNGIWDLYYFKENSLDILTPDDLETKKLKKIKGTVPGN